MILLDLNPEKDIIGKKLVAKRAVFEKNGLNRNYQRGFSFVLLVVQLLFLQIALS